MTFGLLPRTHVEAHVTQCHDLQDFLPLDSSRLAIAHWSAAPQCVTGSVLLLPYLEIDSPVAEWRSSQHNNQLHVGAASGMSVPHFDS